MNNRISGSPFNFVFSPDLLAYFVGRDKELTELSAAFDEGAKGVVIVGHAGVGKTSLARVFADQSRERFPGGVYLSPTRFSMPLKLEEMLNARWEGK